jgi:hypothetical protein
MQVNTADKSSLINKSLRKGDESRSGFLGMRSSMMADLTQQMRSPVNNFPTPSNL